jgi:hypothetical protein
MIPQDVALRLQLAAIAGNEPAASFIEIRPLGRDGRPAVRERTFVPVRSLRRAADRCMELAARFNVFVGAAPRVCEDGTAAAVERVWTLWADCDDADALARLRDFRPLPSIVIRTGSDDSAHAYWPLREPLQACWAVRANRRIANALGSDIAATDAARILRPAGTLNHKHKPPRDVICTRLELDVFTFAEVAGNLPDDHAYAPNADALRARGGGSPAGTLGALARVVRAASVGNRNRALFWAACRVRDHADKFDAGEARQALCDAAIAAGLSEDEALRTIRSGLNSNAEAIAA